MDDTTARLADYALAARFADLTPAVVHETRRRLVDSVACAFGAWHDPLCRAARAVAGRQDGPLSASVWGCGWRTSVESAAFANGTQVRMLDLSDMYRVKSGGHPSDVIAAVLAVADMLRADGPAAIEAIVVAYEVYCTFCESIDVTAQGWDQPTFAVLGAAVGAAKVMGLNRDRMGDAIALALAPNLALAQTRTGDLSNWKGAAAANAARNGVFAALLARAGVTGPSAIFEGAGGFWDAVGRFDWRIGDGEPRIARTNLKRYPVCYHGQAAIDAALALRPQLRLDQIERIRIGTYAQAVHYMGKESSRWAPRTRETADHSLPYVVAVALRDGGIDMNSFDEGRLFDPGIGRLMAATVVEEDADLSARYPVSASCRIDVRMRDGAAVAHEVRSPAGHSDHPLSDAELEAKFLSLARGFCSTDSARAVLDALWRFDDARDVRELVALFRADD